MKEGIPLVTAGKGFPPIDSPRCFSGIKQSLTNKKRGGCKMHPLKNSTQKCALIRILPDQGAFSCLSACFAARFATATLFLQQFYFSNGINPVS